MGSQYHGVGYLGVWSCAESLEGRAGVTGRRQQPPDDPEKLRAVRGHAGDAGGCVVDEHLCLEELALARVELEGQRRLVLPAAAPHCARATQGWRSR